MLLVNAVLAMFARVPPNVIVPVVVIGPPVKVKPFTLPAVATLVTVPDPPAATQLTPVPVLDNNCPAVPASVLASHADFFSPHDRLPHTMTVCCNV